ncbi:MAG: hypothetical protein E7375_03745 [Clostridiales bacterium]|nr:hypothetical protein [Clostridiales bacterium]
MKIVVEYVLLENLLINLIVLKTSSLVAKEKGRLYLLSAFLGACFTIVLPLFCLSTIGHIIVQLGLSFVFICLTFRFKTLKKFIYLVLCYFLSLLVYGGAVYLFEGFFGIKHTILVLATIVCLYIVIRFVLKRINRKRTIENFCFDVEIVYKGKSLTCKGFLDSGNLLVDPITDSPVCLINFKLFSEIFNDIQIQDVLGKSEKLKQLKLAHYIPFSTLNNSTKILAFEVDKLSVKGKSFERPILALSFENFSTTFGTDMILHNNYF